MVNQAFMIKIAYRSKEKEKKEKKNTRDRSVPDGSDNNMCTLSNVELRELKTLLNIQKTMGPKYHEV